MGALCTFTAQKHMKKKTNRVDTGLISGTNGLPKAQLRRERTHWSVRASGYWNNEPHAHYSHATDGNEDSFFTTNYAEFNWLEVDFGSVVDSVFLVEVLKRRDLEERFRHVQFRIGNTRTNDDTGLVLLTHNTLCGEMGEQTTDRTTFIRCGREIDGRYLILQQTVVGYLAMAELYVYNDPGKEFHYLSPLIER